LYKAVLLSTIILFSIFSTYNVHAAPSARIIDTYGYLDESGQYVVVGEVVNNGDVPLHFVEVIVTFFDEDKEQLQQLSVSTALVIIHPGQVAPFMVTLRDTQSASLVRTYDAQMGNIAPTTDKERRLSVIFHKLETSEDNIVISGRIANDGTSLSANTKAVVVLYNVLGEPVRFSSVFTDPRNILPFGSALFSTRIKIGDPLQISGYAISAESSTYAETTRLVREQEISLERIREVVDISDLATLDASNRVVSSVGVGNPVLVKLSITNKLAEGRDYTYILQVIDQDGFVSSLSWSAGTLTPRQSNAAIIAWVPSERGTYTLQVFVWKSVEEAVPLAFKTLATNIQVG
jgi:hypothetical protein